LTAPQFANTNLEFIPNMDGFPNGRRLEDDVTRIELQAVAGIVLAAIGLWYDDYTAGSPNPVTADLLDVLTYTTGVEKNDAAFVATFPNLAEPWSGDGECGGKIITGLQNPDGGVIGLERPKVSVVNYPNPVANVTTVKINSQIDGKVRIDLRNQEGKTVQSLGEGSFEKGFHEFTVDLSKIPTGIYFATAISVNGGILGYTKLIKS
jgi:hypothetical protein